MAHIKIPMAEKHMQVWNTDYIVTVNYEVDGHGKPRVEIQTPASFHTLTGDRAAMFWRKYNHFCVEEQRPEVG